MAAASSCARWGPSASSRPAARWASGAGMTSPSSPSVQVTSVTAAPAATQAAMVTPLQIDSSSGWACTSSTRAWPELMAASLTAAARAPGQKLMSLIMSERPVEKSSMAGAMLDPAR